MATNTALVTVIIQIAKMRMKLIMGLIRMLMLDSCVGAWHDHGGLWIHDGLVGRGTGKACCSYTLLRQLPSYLLQSIDVFSN